MQVPGKDIETGIYKSRLYFNALGLINFYEYVITFVEFNFPSMLIV